MGYLEAVELQMAIAAQHATHSLLRPVFGRNGELLSQQARHVRA